MNNRYRTSFVILTILLVLTVIPALAQNSPTAAERPQGQAQPVLAPTGFQTGEGAWIAPPGTSVSFNRATGAASFALATQPYDGSREQIARFENWRKHSYPGTGPYPSTREENEELPTHTLYYPADMTKVSGKMPEMEAAATRPLSSRDFLVRLRRTAISSPPWGAATSRLRSWPSARHWGRPSW